MDLLQDLLIPKWNPLHDVLIKPKSNNKDMRKKLRKYKKIYNKLKYKRGLPTPLSLSQVEKMGDEQIIPIPVLPILNMPGTTNNAPQRRANNLEFSIDLATRMWQLEMAEEAERRHEELAEANVQRDMDAAEEKKFNEIEATVEQMTDESIRNLDQFILDQSAMFNELVDEEEWNSYPEDFQLLLNESRVRQDRAAEAKHDNPPVMETEGRRRWSTLKSIIEGLFGNDRLFPNSPSRTQFRNLIKTGGKPLKIKLINAINRAGILLGDNSTESMTKATRKRILEKIMNDGTLANIVKQELTAVLREASTSQNWDESKINREYPEIVIIPDNPPEALPAVSDNVAAPLMRVLTGEFGMDITESSNIINNFIDVINRSVTENMRTSGNLRESIMRGQRELVEKITAHIESAIDEVLNPDFNVANFIRGLEDIATGIQSKYPAAVRPMIVSGIRFFSGSIQGYIMKKRRNKISEEKENRVNRIIQSMRNRVRNNQRGDEVKLGGDLEGGDVKLDEEEKTTLKKIFKVGKFKFGRTPRGDPDDPDDPDDWTIEWNGRPSSIKHKSLIKLLILIFGTIGGSVAIERMMSKDPKKMKEVKLSKAGGFDGEIHALIQLPDGSFGYANFLGPRTQVIKRLKRGDVGRSAVDWVARRHDIEFALASDIDDETMRTTEVRKADLKMIQALNIIAKNRLDSELNVEVAKEIIQTKMRLEDSGILNPDLFIGMENKPEDIPLLKVELARSDRIIKEKKYDTDGLFREDDPIDNINIDKENVSDGIIDKTGDKLTMAETVKQNRESGPTPVQTDLKPAKPPPNLVLPSGADKLPMTQEWIMKYKLYGVMDDVVHYNGLVGGFNKNMSGDYGEPLNDEQRDTAMQRMFDLYDKIRTNFRNPPQPVTGDPASSSMTDSSAPRETDEHFDEVLLTSEKRLEIAEREYSEAIDAFSTAKTNNATTQELSKLRIDIDRAHSKVNSINIEFQNADFDANPTTFLQDAISEVVPKNPAEREQFKRIQALEKSAKLNNKTLSYDYYLTLMEQNKNKFDSFSSRKAYYDNREKLLTTIHKQRGIAIPTVQGITPELTDDDDSFLTVPEGVTSKEEDEKAQAESKAENFFRPDLLQGGEANLLASTKAEILEENRLWREFSFVERGHGLGRNNPLFLENLREENARYGKLRSVKQTHRGMPLPQGRRSMNTTFVPTYQFDTDFENEQANPFKFAPAYQTSVKQRDWDDNAQIMYPEHVLRGVRSKAVRIPQIRNDGQRFVPYSYKYGDVPYKESSTIAGVMSDKSPYENCWGFKKQEQLDPDEYFKARKS